MNMLMAAVDPLPKPPFLSGLMDGQPWGVSGVLLLLGIGVWAVLRNQGKSRQGAGVFLTLAAVALALQVAAWAVVTERERLTLATEDLVRSVAKVEATRVDQLLADDVRLIADGARFGPLTMPRMGWDKERILSLVQGQLGGAYRVKEYAILRTQAQQRGPTSGRTQVRVRVVPEAYPAPSLSWWRIEWRKDAAGDWQAVLIEPLETSF